MLEKSPNSIDCWLALAHPLFCRQFRIVLFSSTPDNHLHTHAYIITKLIFLHLHTLLYVKYKARCAECYIRLLTLHRPIVRFLYNPPCLVMQVQYHYSRHSFIKYFPEGEEEVGLFVSNDHKFTLISLPTQTSFESMNVM